MKLDAFIRETLTAIGVGEIKANYAPEKAERFEITEEQMEVYKAAMEEGFAMLAEKGFPAKDFQIEIGEGSVSIRWERDRRFSDKFVLRLPLMQSTYNQDAKYDIPFPVLVEQFRIGMGIASVIADGMKNKKLGSYDMSVNMNRDTDPRNAWSEVKSAEAVARYWFDRLEKIEASRVDYYTDWNISHAFSRSTYTPGEAPEVRLNAMMGPRAHFLEDRIGQVRRFDELFEEIKAPISAYKRLSFDIRPTYNANLALMDFEGLKKLSSVTTAAKTYIDSLDFGEAEQDVSLTLGENLSAEVDITEYSGRVRFEVPCLNESRIRESANMEAYLQGVASDWSRVQRLADWMRTGVAGKVSSLSVGYGHATLSMDDAHFDALLAALKPHVDAATMTDQRRSLRIRVERPDATPNVDPYGNVTMPIGFVASEEIGPAVDAFFAEFPIK